MPYVDVLPSKAEIVAHWRERFRDLGIFIDWGEPSCWACGFHYGSKYDVKSPKAGWNEIFDAWNKIPLQRCHIVPRSLGGKDEPSNLFLMCRECHDQAPNFPFTDAFLEWARAQNYLLRESLKLEEAFRSFGVEAERRAEIAAILASTGFKAWAREKIGFHRPQSNYASVLSRLTPATMIGLAVYYSRLDKNGDASP